MGATGENTAVNIPIQASVRTFVFGSPKENPRVTLLGQRAIPCFTF